MTAHADADTQRSHPLRLKKRADFLRAATGRKAHTALFTVQAVAQPAGVSGAPRVGFTVTKKVGNAVERNRIKRRLREAVRLSPGLGIKPSHDYVIVARRAVLDEKFGAIVSGLKLAFGKADRPKTSGSNDRGRRSDAPCGGSRP